MENFFFYLFIAIVFFTSALNFIHYTHMFQLNGYYMGAQLKWTKQNFLSDVFKRQIWFLIPLLLASTEQILHNPSLSYIGACGAMFLPIIFSLPKKAKKKFVYTPRIIRLCVTSAILSAAALIPVFVLPRVYSVLCLIAFQDFIVFLPLIANIVNKPVEKLVNNYYINDAKRIINGHPNLIVIGITGSYGKTSTKFYLEKLLSVKYNVLITPESYNTTMGVVKTIRGKLSPIHDIFICEMGAKNVGEIKEICDIVKPRHSLITSVGPQHLESFKTIENIIKTKFEIADCINPENGKVFLNFDNEYIRENAKTGNYKNVISYGIGAEHNKDVFAENIAVSEKGTSFNVYGHGFETRLLGSHNVENIVGAIAVAEFMGIELSQMLVPVKRLECVKHRLQISNNALGIIIDDAFNSNPIGAKAALDVLKMYDGMRFLVTPGMIELGEKEFELNKEFGKNAAVSCDYAILIGEKQAVPIKAGLLENGFLETKIHVFKTINEGLEFVRTTDSKGKRKVILLENDLPDNY